MLHFDPGTNAMAARSRLDGRRRVADALLNRNLAATSYPVDAGPHSPQRDEIGLALARINGRSQAPLQLAFKEIPVGPDIAPRTLDNGLGRATAMPLHSPAGTAGADASGHHGRPVTHRIAGDTLPMGQLFGTGATPGSDPRRGDVVNGSADPAASTVGQSGSRTGHILPIQRDGETGALSPAIPGWARDVWDEAVSAATLPGDVQSGAYHLPSPGEPGISEDDAYNVYRGGKLLGNRLANERSLTNRAIGAAAALTGGGTGFAAARGARPAMDPSLLRMGGGGGKRPPRPFFNRDSSNQYIAAPPGNAPNPSTPSTLHQGGTRIPGGRTVDATIPGHTKVRNAKGRVFKHVDNPPSKPHAGMSQHTHLFRTDVAPDGRVWRRKENYAVPQRRIDVIDASRTGAKRTGGPK